MPRRNDPDLSRAIGARLAAFRKARGWSQDRLAEAAGVEPLTLSRAEAGARALGLANLARVATAMDCRLGDLLDDSREILPVEAPTDELELIQHYRRVDVGGRKLILGVVRDIARAWPDRRLG